MYVMFNKICTNEEMLPIYIYIYIYITFLYQDQSTLDQGFHEAQGSQTAFHDIRYINLLYNYGLLLLLLLL